MKFDYKQYPPNWLTEIRPRILERAGYKCEKCGAEHHQKLKSGKKVVLQIAHRDHDPQNWAVSDDRLAAFCRRCHLNYDRKECMAKRVRSWKYGRNYLKNQINLDFKKMVMKIKLNYNHQWSAVIEIDEGDPKTQEAIKEMVEFWMGWEDDLRYAKGDYTTVFLTSLTKALLFKSMDGLNVLGIQDEFKNMEGWYPLDGSYGITLVSCDNFEFDEDDITYEKYNPR